MTKYSSRIKEIVETSNQHLTAEQVFFEIKKDFPKIVLATVYNNLNHLCKRGDICRVITGGQPDRFDKVYRHDHLVCSECGKLSDVTYKDLTEDLESNLGHEIKSYNLTINYVCDECRKKKN